MESPLLLNNIDFSALSPRPQKGTYRKATVNHAALDFPSNKAGKSLLLFLPVILTFSSSELWEQLYRSIN